MDEKLCVKILHVKTNSDPAPVAPVTSKWISYILFEFVRGFSAVVQRLQIHAQAPSSILHREGKKCFPWQVTRHP